MSDDEAKTNAELQAILNRIDGDDCGHTDTKWLCRPCVEQDFNAQKELTGFYVEKLNKAEAEIERLMSEPIKLECVVAAIVAVANEARRRGAMFPQTSDEQREDRAAVFRVLGMLNWYEKNTGCANLDGWPERNKSMRVNVYGEESTNRIQLVTATAEGRNFLGIRFYLESSDKLQPPKHPDDDSSAVTFWVKSGKGGYKLGDESALANLFRNAAIMLGEPLPRELTI